MEGPRLWGSGELYNILSCEIQRSRSKPYWMMCLSRQSYECFYYCYMNQVTFTKQLSPRPSAQRFSHPWNSQQRSFSDNISGGVEQTVLERRWLKRSADCAGAPNPCQTAKVLQSSDRASRHLSRHKPKTKHIHESYQ